MTKNAALSLLYAAILAAPVYIDAQVPSDTDAVVRAAVYRQSQLIEARNRLAEATAAETRNELTAASQAYNKALETLKTLGGNVEVEYTQAITGLSRTMLALADQAMRRGDYAGAKINIDRVLKEDPRNKTALEMRKQNDRLIAETYLLSPTPQALTRLAETETNKIAVAKMVQDGKLYYETGRLKEAEDTLRQAIKSDPDSKPAAYYLDLVMARKFSAEARLREVNSKQMIMAVEQEWAGSVKRDALPTPNPYAETNLVHTSSERQNIYLKLRRIRLNEWGPIDNLPLSEVIKVLSDEARKRDPEARPEARGINFLISPNADSATAAGPPALDAAGLPIAAPAEPLDLNAVQVRIGNALHDVTLEQALEIITKVADRRVKYSVEDFGVVISPKAPEPVPLHTRTFRVDPNTFWQGLQSVIGFSFGESQNGGGGGGGGGGRGGGGRGGGGRGGGGLGGGGAGGGQGGQGQGGGAEYAQVSIAGQSAANRGQGGGLGQQQVQPLQPGQVRPIGQGQGIEYLTTVTPTETVIPAVRSFFQTAGVNLNDPGKAVFFNDRLGYLMVRATLQDLDTIDKAIQMLNMSPPQLTIRAKFMEVTQEDNRALGFDWYLGNKLLNNGSIGAQGGSAPSFIVPGSSSPANPSGVFPGPGAGPGLPGPFALPAAPTDNLLTGGLRNNSGAPAIATVTGILTDPQFRMVVRALEQRGGTDLLQCPEVTTMSGRQAQIKVVDIRYIVTDLDQTQTGGGGVATAIGGAQGAGGGVATTVQPIAEPFEIGPVLDVVPYVNADGYTIQLTILPTLKEFLGYDDPGQFVAQAQSVGATGGAGTPLVTPIPLPRFRLRQVATTASVWDGQTVVLGGLISEDVQKTKDKVPVLGDIPFLGRFFRSEANHTSKKNLVIFVTPTLIDPAGNRKHDEADLPFAQHAIPTPARVATP